MASFKSPGSDGLHAGFYQNTWETTGDPLFRFVSAFLDSGILPEVTNDTLLVLIPKTKFPKVLSQFRPHQFVSGLLKGNNKTLANRLKKIMQSMIGPNQSSFVPGRQITDNIIIYQEVLHSMRKSKVGKGIMLIKIDLEKAYDRLSWPFIRDTLETMGLPSSWIKNIMHCVDSTNMSVIWNGNQLASFKHTRGIRQAH